MVIQSIKSKIAIGLLTKDFLQNYIKISNEQVNRSKFYTLNFILCFIIFLSIYMFSYNIYFYLCIYFSKGSGNLSTGTVFRGHQNTFLEFSQSSLLHFEKPERAKSPVVPRHIKTLATPLCTKKTRHPSYCEVLKPVVLKLWGLPP